MKPHRRRRRKNSESMTDLPVVAEDQPEASNPPAEEETPATSEQVSN